MRLENCLESTFELEVPLVIDGEKFKTLVVRELIGTDEEYISQPKFKNSLAMIFPELIQRCIAEVPNAKRTPTLLEIKKLPAFQMDLIIKEIRKVSVGEDIETEIKCSNKDCGKAITHYKNINDIDLKGDLLEPTEIELVRGFTIDGENFKKCLISPVDGFAQEKLLSKKDLSQKGVIDTELILACTQIPGKKISKEMVSALNKRDREAILNTIKKFKSLNIEEEMECTYCGKINKFNVGMLDFLY